MRTFADRRDAGRELGKLLTKYAPRHSGGRTIVFGLPRGGLPVAYEVAKAIEAPLDVFIVRKIGVPWHPELAMGAIASGGTVVSNPEVLRSLRIDDATFERVVENERRELERREIAYRGNNPQPAVNGATCIVVDDGIATGASMMAAVMALRDRKPKRIVVATPIAAPTVHMQFAGKADDVVCVFTPPEFTAVGLWYEDFEQTEDEEVTRLLQDARSLGLPWNQGGDLEFGSAR
jgi:putative phosphoribosyl transferase